MPDWFAHLTEVRSTSSKSMGTLGTQGTAALGVFHSERNPHRSSVPRVGIALGTMGTEAGNADETLKPVPNVPKSVPRFANEPPTVRIADDQCVGGDVPGVPSVPTQIDISLRRTADADAFEERAAIAEFDGGLCRQDAEDLAAREQGFANVVCVRAALARREEKS